MDVFNNSFLNYENKVEYRLSKYEKIRPYKIFSSISNLNSKTRGSGYLAGELPNGITKVDNQPASVSIRCFYRDTNTDGQHLVATTTSAADGTWIIDNLNPDLTYDVVASITGYRDAIMSDVSPVNPIRLTSSATSQIAVQEYFSYLIEYIGGVGVKTVQISVGSLPTGLSLTGNKISGTPTTIGVYNFTVMIQDESLAFIEIPFIFTTYAKQFTALYYYDHTIESNTFAVNDPLVIDPPQLFYGLSPYTFSVKSGALPTGTTLDTAGKISGTITATGTYTFEIEAADSNGSLLSRSYTITCA